MTSVIQRYHSVQFHINYNYELIVKTWSLMIRQLLDDRLKEKLLRPLFCICLYVRWLHTSWSRNLIWLLLFKKSIILYPFYGYFFPYSVYELPVTNSHLGELRGPYNILENQNKIFLLFKPQHVTYHYVFSDVKWWKYVKIVSGPPIVIFRGLL